ncbi:MAG: hypothetical protein ABSE40_19445 [Candidatus Sulfotelmatobacter sp.]|jgi:hypothetical protein
MTAPLKWERCVVQRDSDVTNFVNAFFSDKQRKVLLIAGAGFDPRASRVCELLSGPLGKRLSAMLIREERPNAEAELCKRAEQNLRELLGFVPDARVIPLNIFAMDNAVIGGREAVKAVAQIPLSDFTDVVVDKSALSRGVTFPVIKFLLQSCKLQNVHVFVIDEPVTDEEIFAVAWEQASSIHGFRGTLGPASELKPARLWLPQLVRGQNLALDLIYKLIQPHDVCPILPFPASDPRLPDRLIEEYATEMESGWKVDPRNIVYADEKSPLDLYRAILRIDDARKVIFQGFGSQIVLSPVGSKLLSMGALFAALERDFPVVYVEAVAYKVNFEALDQKRQTPGSLVHLWLGGEAYGQQDS